MQKFSTSPRELLSSLWCNRELTIALIEREVIGRYRGSVIGVFWSFAHPMFMLAVYTFVFSIVFQAKWGTGSESKAEFALVLFAGLIIFNFFAECVNRSPGLILSNVNYVKRVVFPLEILIWVTLGSALFHSLVSLLVWLLFYFALFGIPHSTVFLLPFVMLPLMFLTAGTTWFFAALGVYVRDLAQATTILTTVLMFLSPIFYPVSAIPSQFRLFLLLNPLSPALEHIRQVLMWGEIPNVWNWGIYLAASALIAWLGYAWFQKTRRGFADVL